MNEKEYQKPEVEIIELETDESIAAVSGNVDDIPMDGDVID